MPIRQDGVENRDKVYLAPLRFFFGYITVWRISRTQLECQPLAFSPKGSHAFLLQGKVHASLQKHPFLLALRRWGRFAKRPRRRRARRNGCFRRLSSCIHFHFGRTHWVAVPAGAGRGTPYDKLALSSPCRESLFFFGSFSPPSMKKTPALLSGCLILRKLRISFNILQLLVRG